MLRAASTFRLAWLLATALAPVALFATSANGTLDWRRVVTSPLAAIRHDDFFFYGTDVGWIIQVGGQIWKTTDTGATWSIVATINNPNRLRCVGFASEQHGWTGVLGDCSLVGGNAPFLYETTDGGVTWNEVTNVPDPKPQGLCGIWVVDPNVVYACGRYCSTPRVIKTTDAERRGPRST